MLTGGLDSGNGMGAVFLLSLLLDAGKEDVSVINIQWLMSVWRGGWAVQVSRLRDLLSRQQDEDQQLCPNAVFCPYIIAMMLYHVGICQEKPCGPFFTETWLSFSYGSVPQSSGLDSILLNFQITFF